MALRSPLYADAGCNRCRRAVYRRQLAGACGHSLIFLLYSVYQRPDMARRVLLVFVMLGAGSLIDYGFIPYLIVMAAGCVQMRVMGMRCIIAMLAGTLVPLWVLGLLGLLSHAASLCRKW